MIWFFERGPDAIRIETRYHAPPGEYVVTIFWPNNRVETERFHSQAVFRARLSALERQLTADQWRQVGGPALLSDDS